MEQLRLALAPSPELVRKSWGSDTALYAIAGELVRRSDFKSRSMINADLTSDEGRNKALKTQGEARGLLQAAEIIIDLVEEGLPNGRRDDTD